LVFPMVHIVSNYTVNSTNVMIMADTTGGSMWVFLPLANDWEGRAIAVFDEGEYVGINPIYVVCDDADKFPRYDNPVAITDTFSGLRFMSNGHNKWLVNQIN
jgi:hypothetical protein